MQRRGGEKRAYRFADPLETGTPLPADMGQGGQAAKDADGDQINGGRRALKQRQDRTPGLTAKRISGHDDGTTVVGTILGWIKRHLTMHGRREFGRGNLPFFRPDGLQESLQTARFT